jgi:hypothetical protein
MFSSLSRSIFVNKIWSRLLASAGFKWSNSSASLTLPVHISNILLQKAYILYFPTTNYRKNWGSSVSIPSDYRQDDWGLSSEAKDFSSSLCVQIGFEAYPPSYWTDTGGPLPRCKTRPRHDTDHSPPSRAEVKNE